MKSLMKRSGSAALPLGWLAAAALAAAPGTVVAGDDYARAAEENGTAEFVAQAWAPASTYERPAAPARAHPRDYAQAAEKSGTAEFVAQAWAPASTYERPAAPARADARAVEPGAASGEPDEAVTEDAEARARREWLESIWNSP
jgi:hypothetical protein